MASFWYIVEPPDAYFCYLLRLTAYRCDLRLQQMMLKNKTDSQQEKSALENLPLKSAPLRVFKIRQDIHRWSTNQAAVPKEKKQFIFMRNLTKKSQWP